MAAPWGRLLALCMGLCIAAGLSPAASSYIGFFVKSGVAARGRCQHGVRQCELQESYLGRVVLDAQIASKAQGFCGAYVFQQAGAKPTLQSAAYMHITGWFALLLFHIADVKADPCWKYSIFLIDMSRGFIKYVPYAFLIYFPGQAGTVLALGNAGHESASVFALILINIMQWSELEMFGLAAAQIALGVFLLTFGPTLLPASEFETSTSDQVTEEDPEDDSPQERTGYCDETCAAFKDTCRCLYPNKCLHLFVLFVFGYGPVWSAQFQAIAVVWGNLLFQSRTDVDFLTSSITISTFVANCIVSPIIAAYLKKFGLSTLVFGLSFLQFACSELVLREALWCQCFVGFVAVLMYAVEPVLQGQHLFAFVDLRFAGMASFIWAMFVFEFYSSGVEAQSEWFKWADSTPYQFWAYAVVLHYVIRIGAYAYLFYGIVSLIFPLPSKPVVPPQKQAELSKPYACRNFDQVSKILNYPLDLTERTLLQQTRDKISWATLISHTQLHALRDRLSQLTYDELSELLVSGNLFWKPNYKNIKQVKGLVMAGVAMPGAQFEQLLRSQVDVDSFGRGTSKSLDVLKREISTRRSSFEVDESNPDKLVRVTTVVVLRISVDVEGKSYFLIQVGSTYTDETMKQFFRFPATKKEAGLSVDDTIFQILNELGMDSVPVEIDEQHHESSVEITESESYPGLLTRYVKKLVGVQISTTSNNCFPDIGLTPEPKQWQKYRPPQSEASNMEKTKSSEIYEWLLEDDIQDRDPQFLIHYPKPKPDKVYPSEVDLDLHVLLTDRKNVMKMLRHARANRDWELKSMYLTEPCGRYLRSLPYWLLGQHIEFHRDKCLKILSRIIIDNEERPHHDTLVESLLLDLFVHKQQAKNMLAALELAG